LKINEKNNSRKNIVKGHFSNNTEYWDILYDDFHKYQSFTKYELKRRKEIVFNFIDKIKLNKNKRILDLGCGTGHYLTQLHSMGFQCFGADISEEMLQRTRDKFISSKSNDPTLINSDCYNLPLDGNYFDLIICIGVLEYLDSEIKALIEMKRIILPSGLVIITFPNFYKLRNLLNPYYYIVRIWTYLFSKKSIKSFQSSENKNVKIDFNKSTVSRYSLMKVKKILSNSGFKIIEIEGYCYGPFSLWKEDLFPLETSIKISEFIDKLSGYKIFGFLKYFSNRWVLLLQPEKS
jgi:ubiquinone/menaquinone biosynthesis C-methylase UbiE